MGRLCTFLVQGMWSHQSAVFPLGNAAVSPGGEGSDVASSVAEMSDNPDHQDHFSSCPNYSPGCPGLQTDQSCPPFTANNSRARQNTALLVLHPRNLHLLLPPGSCSSWQLAGEHQHTVNRAHLSQHEAVVRWGGSHKGGQEERHTHRALLAQGIAGNLIPSLEQQPAPAGP